MREYEEHPHHHRFVGLTCWYCEELAPGGYEFRRPAISTFGWTYSPSDFEKVRERWEAK